MEINDSALWYGLDEKSSKKAPRTPKRSPCANIKNQEMNVCLYMSDKNI